jgi:protein TonB
MKKSLLLTILFVACFGFAQVQNQDIQKNKEPISDVKIPEDGSLSPEAPVGGNEIICTAPLIDVAPSYPGGFTKFTEDIKSAINLKSLEPGFENQTLKVYVGFVIEKDGTLTNIKILRDPGYGIAKEIERVMKLNKTKWIPGLLKSKPIRSDFKIPITLEQKK